MRSEQSGRRAANRVRRALLAVTVSATAGIVAAALLAPGSGSVAPAPAGLRIAGASFGVLVPAIPPTPRATPDVVSSSPSAAPATDEAPPTVP
ncbi:MAG: hypothetical protein JWL78_1092 [Chloroflexi bacterium]|nr:hypothetical protein [Chloroflexota bacterium]